VRAWKEIGFTQNHLGLKMAHKASILLSEDRAIVAARELSKFLVSEVRTWGFVILMVP
jgi:hypothetical protein